ncbi:LPS assembly lipoprotein LptE [Leptospira sp. GIMC2001]|uniref:LPS assembly lipoprotein LptE n=1 Tax=Leptospira sp. GIMC2001 TaxID=1513297 RepID=UPI002349D500|nr:LPS assembly lipoprotein LptE [Leptospira sp. GIMC2001]WCL48647.1 LPS assembly lipoprotein LptE [Leptospira sp. GIMC2001]
MNRRKSLNLLVFVFVIGLSSCSYFHREPGNPPKFRGTPLPDSVRTVYIQNFRNASYAPQLHTMVTQYLKSEVDRRGRFIQVRDKFKAAYRIHGEVTHYQLVGNLMDLGDQHLSSEMFSITKIELHKADTNERIELERTEIPGRAYFSRQLGYRESEIQAQDRMARVMAVKIAEELERAWYFSIAKNIDE